MKNFAVPQIDDNLRKVLALPPVTQIGFVVQNIEKSVRYFSEWFGVGPWEIVTPKIVNQTYHGRPVDYRLKFAFAEQGPLQWEFIQVLKGPTIYEDDLGKDGEGLHHLRCRVSNLDERLEAVQRMGIQIVQTGQRSDVKSKFAYLDLHHMAGLTLELTQRPYPLI